MTKKRGEGGAERALKSVEEEKHERARSSVIIHDVVAAFSHRLAFEKLAAER